MPKYCSGFDYNCKYCSDTCQCMTERDCKKQIELDPTPEMKMVMANFLQQKKQRDTIIWYLNKIVKGK